MKDSIATGFFLRRLAACPDDEDFVADAQHRCRAMNHERERTGLIDWAAKGAHPEKGVAREITEPWIDTTPK